MTLTFVLGLILVWIIGFPAYIFYKLHKNRLILDNEQLVTTYGLFYVGLRDDAYYFEILITNSRKILFFSFSSLLFETSSSVKGLLAVLFLFIQS
jgi:hypothetical protein